MSISFAPELGDAVGEAAGRAGRERSRELRTLCGAAGNDGLVIGC